MGMGWWCRRTLFTLRDHEPKNPFTQSLISGRRYYYSDNKRKNFPNSKPKWWWVQHRKPLLAVFVGCSGITIYLRNQEIIPYTNRTHFVYVSAETEKLRSEARLKELKQGLFKGKILPADHPKTLRVNSIAQNLIKALEDGISQIGPDSDLSDQFKLETKRAKLSWKRGKAQPDIRHLERLNWEAIVVDLPYPEAKCIPAGKIFVCNGALEHFETDAEIAALIAHQVGHMVARHLVERMTKEIWKTFLKKLLYYVMKRSVVNSMSFLEFRPSSTEIEIEANYIGLMLMASAGYDPTVAMLTYLKQSILTLNYPNKPCMVRSEALTQTHALEKAMKLYRAKKKITDHQI